jgi:hypothetical protein
MNKRIEPPFMPAVNEPPPDLVWMQSPAGGELKHVEGRPEILTPLMVAGWTQAHPPPDEEEKLSAVSSQLSATPESPDGPGLADS